METHVSESKAYISDVNGTAVISSNIQMLESKIKSFCKAGSPQQTIEGRTTHIAMEDF
jgi:hypothetical protein